MFYLLLQDIDAVEAWTKDFAKKNGGKAPSKQEKKEQAGPLLESAKKSSKVYEQKLSVVEAAEKTYGERRAALKSAKAAAPADSAPATPAASPRPAASESSTAVSSPRPATGEVPAGEEMAALQEQVTTAKAAYEAASKELQEAETQMNKVCRHGYVDTVCRYSM